MIWWKCWKTLTKLKLNTYDGMSILHHCTASYQRRYHVLYLSLGEPAASTSLVSLGDFDNKEGGLPGCRILIASSWQIQSFLCRYGQVHAPGAMGWRIFGHFWTCFGLQKLAKLYFPALWSTYIINYYHIFWTPVWEEVGSSCALTFCHNMSRFKRCRC